MYQEIPHRKLQTNPWDRDVEPQNILARRHPKANKSKSTSFLFLVKNIVKLERELNYAYQNKDQQKDRQTHGTQCKRHKNTDTYLALSVRDARTQEKHLTLSVRDTKHKPTHDTQCPRHKNTYVYLIHSVRDTRTQANS